MFEILLKFMETRDWKEAFFQVIPQRKMGDLEAQDQTDDAYYDETVSTSIERGSENEGEQVGIISKKPRLVDIQSGAAITVDGGGPKDLSSNKLSEDRTSKELQLS